MKAFLIFMGVLVAVIATGFWFSVASAIGPAYPYAVGGTGSSTVPALGQVFYAGVTGWQSRATTTASCSGTASCTAFVIFGNTPVTITGAAGTSASTTLLSDSNTFSGVLNKFMGNLAFINATSTGSLSVSASTTIAGAFNSVVANILGSSTLLNNTLLTNATTSTFAITGTLAANCNGTSALTTTSSGIVNCTAQPQGTVTAVSIATANGFAGSSGGGATPALTITTSVTGLLLGNGTAAAAYGGTSCTNAIVSLNASGSATCGGFAWPFASTLNFGALANSTSTPIWFTKGLMASSTSYFNSAFNASSTAPQLFLDDLSSALWSFRNIGGNLYIGTSTQGVPNATSSISALSISKGGQVSIGEDIPATSTAMVVDWLATKNQVDLQVGTAAITIGFNNASTSGMTKRIVICNSGTAASTVTWSVLALLWSGGTAPTQTTTANKCDAYSFIITQGTSTINTTTKILGGASQNY